MQSIENDLRNFIKVLNKEFEEIHGGSFVRIDTGEIFTKTEVTKYIKRQVELFTSKQLQDIKSITYNEIGTHTDQILISKRSKQKIKINTKANYDGGEFNIVYRNKAKDVFEMLLDKSEKLVYFSLRDFITYPQNCVQINGDIPTKADLQPIVGLEEKTIRKALISLEQKGFIKQIRDGRRWIIYVNPEYYASGKELDIYVLKLFNLIDCDDEKIDSYIGQ